MPASNLDGDLLHQSTSAHPAGRSTCAFCRRQHYLFVRLFEEQGGSEEEEEEGDNDDDEEGARRSAGRAHRSVPHGTALPCPVRRMRGAQRGRQRRRRRRHSW